MIARSEAVRRGEVVQKTKAVTTIVAF